MYIKYKNRSMRILMAIIIAIGFASCRNYQELTKVPQPDTKNLVRDAVENSTDTTSLSMIPWKSYFPDVKLQTLIAEGLDHGYNMKVAMTRIQQAEAGLYISKSAFLPTVSAAARIDHTRFSSGSGGTDVFGYYSNVNSMGITASWEADLWGKLNSQTKSKFVTYLNTLEYKKLIQTTLISSIAKSYYSLMALDEQLRTTRETIVLLQKSTETMQALKDAGQQTEAAVEQSKALIYSTKLSVFDLESKMRQQENVICVLIGRKPGEIERGSINDQNIPSTMNGNVSVRTLANRPDVKQAELSLQSAYALTDAAKAAFYPSFSIGTLSVGFAAGGFANFFKPANLAAEIVAGFAQPIFSRGQLKGNLKITQAQQEEALLTFSNTILVAGQEVSDILFSYKSLVNKNEWRDKQVESLTKAVDYTQELLKAGEANYTEVLSAQKDLLTAQLSKVNDKLDQLNQSVSLYKALGGGIQ
ncbi:MAG: efflux transporter outer membrane subunit [Bacteroidales bacterium]|nr:efflux transporter outer membrane subunit [Bacteroidales bacterium]